MRDWLPAGQVPEIFGHAPAQPNPVADPSNPYAAPDSTWSEVARVTAGESLDEIPPGSEPIDIGGCLKRGFELTKRHFGIILLVALTYFGVTIGTSMVLGLIDSALGIGQTSSNVWQSDSGNAVASYNRSGSPLSIIISQLLSIFLSLGAARIGLNLVSGKEVSVAMLFGEGRKLLPALGASILFGLMVGLGLVLLIVPGVYLAMRFGQYLTAIVDRDLGVMESLKYSSAITTNNRINYFGLAVLCLLIVIAGALACGVGLVFALPVAWLSSIVAYRWMQYGHRSALDHHGTKTPMLAKL